MVWHLMMTVSSVFMGFVLCVFISSSFSSAAFFLVYSFFPMFSFTAESFPCAFRLAVVAQADFEPDKAGGEPSLFSNTSS